MSDSVSINYSFQASPTTTEPVGPEPLLALADCDTINLPDNQVMLIQRPSRISSGGQRLIVTRDVAIALDFCREFCTLQEHATALVARMPELGGNEADVLRVLAGVRDAGMMVSANDICDHINSSPTERGKPAPARAFIITCDRPDCLKRLLASIPAAALAALDGLYVVDNSRTAANQARNEQLLASFSDAQDKEAPGGPYAAIHYVGPDRQHHLLTTLHTALPALKTQIGFLLDAQRWSQQPSYGLSRNLCLLLSVDYRCVMLDDDVICQRFNPLDSRPGARFSNPERQVRLEPRGEALPGEFQQDAVDPIRSHLQCLGATLASAMPDLGSDRLTPEQLHGMDVRQASNLTSGHSVNVTESGSLGDHGASDNNWMLYLNRDQLGKLDEYPGGTAAAFSNRWGWVGQSTATFSRRSVISQVTGVNNTVMLPPYIPVLRGEDQLFGQLTRYLHPDSLSLQYPWAVPHLPPGERHSGLDLATSGFGIGLLCRYLRTHLPEAGGDPDTRLKLLADMLAGLAQGSDEELLGEYRSSMARFQGEAITDLAHQLSLTDDESSELANTLRDAINQLYTSLQQIDGPEQLLNRDASQDSPGRSTLLQEARQLLRDYARALRAWPSIRKAARQLT